MPEFPTSKPSSSPSRPLHNVKLPPIRSLIEDIPGENLGVTSSRQRDPFTTTTSPRQPKTPSSNLVSNKPRDLTYSDRRPLLGNSTTWDANFSPGRPAGTNYYVQSPKLSSPPQHINSSGMSSSNLKHQTRLETSPNFHRPSSGPLANVSVLSSNPQVQPIIIPGKLPLPPLESPSILHRTSYSQGQEMSPQRYHQHHISTKASAIIADQQAQPYVCQECNKVFSRPSSLKIHGHSHTGEKPFRCPHADCGKAFSVRSNMKRHEKGCHEA